MSIRSLPLALLGAAAITALAYAQQPSPVPPAPSAREQALTFELSQAIDGKIACNTSLVQLQQRDAVAQARIRELEVELAKLKPPEPAKPETPAKK